MPLVTCAALVLALANPASAGVFTLGEDCGPRSGSAAFVVGTAFRQPLTVEAGKHRIAGLQIVDGGNLTWRGGIFVAPGGSPPPSAQGPKFYGVLLNRARNVTLDGVALTDARKGVVVKASSGITLTRSRCYGRVEDCMIVADSRMIRFVNNQADNIEVIRSRCNRGGAIRELVPRKLCVADGGTWTDGWHSDVLQLRDAVIDVLASGNRIDTKGQGLTQMDAKTDRPLAQVRFENNIIASGRHGLTLTNCSDCRITGNQLSSSVPGWQSVIRPGDATVCGNIVPDGGPGEGKCPG